MNTINRLSTLTHKQSATTLAGYTYAYDGMSRPTSFNSTIEGVSLYSYDATSQVTGADHSTQTDETYGYDLNGNRNTSGYTIASNNRTTAGQGFTYTYDDEGNRLTRTQTSTGKVQSYDWDYRNRLVSVKDRNTSGGSIVKQVNYEYDAINRMVRRELDADGAGSGAATNQYWIYDEGINAILQFEGSAASTLSHRYLWSNQVDELFADEQVTSLSTGGNILWGLADHLGSLRDIADMNESTGVTTVTNHRTFSVTGKLVAETNTAIDLLFAFTGKQLDEATGLQHNLNRWYDPGLGQWISEDPIGFAAGDENVRRYVANRATMERDTLGLFIDPPEDGGSQAGGSQGEPPLIPDDGKKTKLKLKWEFMDIGIDFPATPKDEPPLVPNGGSIDIDLLKLRKWLKELPNNNGGGNNGGGNNGGGNNGGGNNGGGNNGGGNNGGGNNGGGNNGGGNNGGGNNGGGNNGGGNNGGGNNGGGDNPGPFQRLWRRLWRR